MVIRLKLRLVLFLMYLFVNDHIKDAIFYLQGSDIKTVAATEKTDQHIYDINFNEGVAIIMGSEDRGVNPSPY